MTTIIDPAALVRGYDQCAREGCGHDRRWHAPCTARVPAVGGGEDAMCGCPAYASVEDLARESAAEARAAAVVEAAAAAQVEAQKRADALDATIRAAAARAVAEAGKVKPKAKG